MNHPSQIFPSRPVRQTHLLRRGRVSIPGARYFITLVTANRQSGLTSAANGAGLLETCRTQYRDGDYDLLMATLMPDHLHLLLTLGKRLTLSQVIGKYKSRSPLEATGSGLRWQDNFFDHRLRHDDALEPFARYLFLNPYRGGLIDTAETWPWFVRNRRYQPGFWQAPEQGKFPQPELIAAAESIEDLIQSDRIDEDEVRRRRAIPTDET